MKDIRINKLHRYVGIVIAPLIVLQTISGLLLEFGLFRRIGSPQIGDRYQGAWGALDRFLVQIHFGPGLLSDIYHIMLGLGIVWMAVSGWLIFLRIRRVMKNAGKGPAR